MLWSGGIEPEIKRAGEHIRRGGLVAFPTETVYGLGGDAFNPEAVARIYAAKGRPGDNPLILHVCDILSFYDLAESPPDYASALIDAYWPGPLTLVAKKKPSLPPWFGGHPDTRTETIGIRMPSHSIARAFIEESGRIIAAPSANKAGRPSPTTAEHVLEDFSQEKDIMILEGGSAEVGLESTVVDVTGENPVILRPGFVTAGMVAKAVPHFSNGENFSPFEKCNESTLPRSPGMKYRHYAPKAPMTLLSGKPENIAAYTIKELNQSPCITGILIQANTRRFFPENLPDDKAKILISGDDYQATAHNLFACLRIFDKLGVDRIFAEAVPDSGIGVAIMDRMRKASEGRVIHV